MNDEKTNKIMSSEELDDVLPKYEPIKLSCKNLGQNYVSAFNTGMNIYQCVNYLQGNIDWTIKAVNDVVKSWNTEVSESIDLSKAIVRETTTEQFNTEWTNKQPELIEQVNTLTTNQFNEDWGILENRINTTLETQNTKINSIQTQQTNLANQQTNLANEQTTLSNRMDTFTSLSAGSTTGDAELQDIRVGANGVTYNNAGDAVRGQYSQLKEDLNELGITNVTSPTDYALQFPNVNKSLNNNGELYDLNGYNTSDFIEYGEDVIGIYRTGTEVKFYLFRYAYYDTNKNLLEFKNDTTDYDIVDYNGKRVTWLTDAPEGTKYVRVCYDTARSMYEYYIVKNVIVGHDIPNLTTDGHNILKLKGKTIVNFGDSIFGNKRPPKDISTEIANITGATVYNCAFGGCRMSKRSDLTTWDAFAMYNLSYSIANNDYIKQDSAISDTTWTDKPSYFDETLSLLKSIDFSKVDIITISYATNDWYAGAPITDGNETRDMLNFCDAMRYSIETIASAFPQIEIFMCCPTWRFWENYHLNGVDADYIDSDELGRPKGDGVKLTDFVYKIKEISKEYHLPCIDNYYDIPINKFNRTHWFPSGDGTHHNVLGGKLIAQHMVNNLY